MIYNTLCIPTKTIQGKILPRQILDYYDRSLFSSSII